MGLRRRVPLDLASAQGPRGGEGYEHCTPREADLPGKIEQRRVNADYFFLLVAKKKDDVQPTLRKDSKRQRRTRPGKSR